MEDLVNFQAMNGIKKMNPFNRRVRDLLDEIGWEQTFVFAEPLVFWITNAPTVPAYPPLLNKMRQKKVLFLTHTTTMPKE